MVGPGELGAFAALLPRLNSDNLNAVHFDAGGPSMIFSTSTFVRLFAAAAIAGAGLTAAGAPAGAETQLLSCSGLSQIVSQNPPTGSSSAKYVKWAVKDSDGSKTDLYGGPVPTDAFGCSVDPGIATPNVATNSSSGKDNPFDDQTNGATALTTGGLLAKTTMSLAGSGSCRTDLPNTTYPSAYPIQGKAITKFDQTTATGAQIQMQSYIRLGADPADPDGDITVRGIVMKGPGIGGEVRATLALFPTNSVKNVNAIDCSALFTPSPAGNAAVVEMKLSQADGSDSGSAVDPWEVVLP
jgi:hypothetical protein